MTLKIGFFAALAALFLSVAYGVPQIMQLAGLLADPLDRILIFAPSLALAPAFVLTMAAVTAWAPQHDRVLGIAALALAIMYGVLVGIVYVVQLGAVIPLESLGQGGALAAFGCCDRFQPLTAVDLLGYTMMSVSTGFAAPLFRGSGLFRAARLSLWANALLAPVLILQLAWPSLIHVGALWLITFPLAMLFIALVFRDEASADR